MTKYLNKSSVYKPGLLFIILIPASIMTLYINPSIQDPFNSPKLWILIITGSWLIGVNFAYKNQTIHESYLVIKKFGLIIISFVFFLFLSSIFTDVKYTAFLGDNQRKLGFITYFFLALFMYSTAKFIQFVSINLIYKSIFITSLLTAVYSYIQSIGNDFIKWNNPYNSIIGTLGNPNYASALMAIFAIINLTIFFISSYKKVFRVISLLLSFLLIYLVYQSNSRQGLVSFTIGAGILICVIITTKSQKIGLLSFILLAVVGLLGILGMLQRGPLTELLYKTSVSIRGFYWRAGIEMFKDNLFTGVGIDRYGAYFKQYREMQYPLNYGFDITSTNAHNVFIQLFATGGLFLGTTYILLVFYILSKGISAIRNSRGTQRISITGLFSAWIVFQAQSIVSIDNIGLAIWGWILGGAIVGLSHFKLIENSVNSINIKTRNNNSKHLAQPMISGVLALIVIVFCSILLKGESGTYNTRVYFDPTNSTQHSNFDKSATDTLNSPLVEPYYKMLIADMLAGSGNKDKANEIIDRLIASDPRNQDYLSVAANLAESVGDYNKAIKTRLNLEKFDRWNAKNLLQIGKDYKALGDFENMSKILTKINSFASQTDIGNTAKSELVRK